MTAIAMIKLIVKITTIIITIIIKITTIIITIIIKIIVTTIIIKIRTIIIKIIIMKMKQRINRSLLYYKLLISMFVKSFRIAIHHSRFSFASKIWIRNCL